MIAITIYSWRRPKLIRVGAYEGAPIWRVETICGHRIEANRDAATKGADTPTDSVKRSHEALLRSTGEVL